MAGLLSRSLRSSTELYERLAPQSLQNGVNYSLQLAAPVTTRLSKLATDYHVVERLDSALDKAASSPLVVSAVDTLSKTYADLAPQAQAVVQVEPRALLLSTVETASNRLRSVVDSVRALDVLKLADGVVAQAAQRVAAAPASLQAPLNVALRSAQSALTQLHALRESENLRAAAQTKLSELSASVLSLAESSARSAELHSRWAGLVAQAQALRGKASSLALPYVSSLATLLGHSVEAVDARLPQLSALLARSLVRVGVESSTLAHAEQQVHTLLVSLRALLPVAEASAAPVVEAVAEQPAAAAEPVPVAAH